jgi:type III pantothenate kinase
MLLVCDIGNSNIVFGLYDGEALRAHWRITSRLNATVDEYMVMMGTLLQRELDGDGRRIDSGILSSVVPPLTGKISQVVQSLAGRAPLEVGPGIKTGLDVQYEDPREVGADRIVNAVGALARHAPPLVIVDFGTATTYDVILAPNVYLGGIITPGLYIALDALVSRTAKLPKVELRPAERLVGRNTADSIRSGLVNGTAAQADGLIEAICQEQGLAPTVLATGGYAGLIQSASRRIQHVEPDLTLFGLREIWLRNR